MQLDLKQTINMWEHLDKQVASASIPQKILQHFPAKCTGMIALVLDVIDFWIDDIEIFKSLSTSANTGVAPFNKTELAVATN